MNLLQEAKNLLAKSKESLNLMAVAIVLLLLENANLITTGKSLVNNTTTLTDLFSFKILFGCIIYFFLMKFLYAVQYVAIRVLVPVIIGIIETITRKKLDITPKEEGRIFLPYNLRLAYFHVAVLALIHSQYVNKTNEIATLVGGGLYGIFFYLLGILLAAYVVLAEWRERPEDKDIMDDLK